MSERIEGSLTIPPATIAGLSFVGISLSDWVLIATLIWIGTQFSYFVYKRYKEWKTPDDGK